MSVHVGRQLERELNAVTEQRDRLQKIVDEQCRVSSVCREYREQRDRLAEVLLKCRKFMNEESVTLPFCVIDEALATVGVVIPRRRGRRER